MMGKDRCFPVTVSPIFVEKSLSQKVFLFVSSCSFIPKTHFWQLLTIAVWLLCLREDLLEINKQQQEILAQKT